ncbi:MAG TPA: response regulator [Chloroflexota bacterium]|nr:response regulator [Chloroflexota bacterium]
MAANGTKPALPGPLVVIDDEPYALRAMSYLLTREGYEVVTASNGEEGLQRVQELRPPLVFLDIMMPQLDGYEVCQRIRSDPSLNGTYIVMLSAKGQQVDRERGLAEGANEYMTKPFSPREVVKRLAEIFGEQRAAES